MRTLMKNQDLLKRVTCFIAAFTLAFSLFGTPAYAAEAAEAPAATAETLSTAAETPAAPKYRLSLQIPRLSRLLLRIRLTRPLIT